MVQRSEGHQPATSPPDQAAGGAATPAPPQGLRGYLAAMGPGLIVAFMWLGTGDLIDSSVAGASYGYALTWGLAVALFCRYIYVSNISKYQLCNQVGDTSILQGFRRIWVGFPVLLGGAGLCLGFVYISYLMKAMGVALANLTGHFAGQATTEFLFAAIMAAVSIGIVLSSRSYRILEIVAKFSAALLTLTLVTAVIIQGADFGAMLRGLSFSVPEDRGEFGAMLVVVSLIGAVGGSAANLLYPYFMQDKGWKGPAYRGMQRFDLLVGIMSIVVLNLCVWFVAAEAFPGAEGAIESEQDLALMMEIAVGSAGPTILWIGLFFVALTSVPSYATGFSRLLVDGIHRSFASRGDRFSDFKLDPIYKGTMIFMLTAPLVFSLPNTPNLVFLTVVGSAFAVLSAPIIIAGVIYLTTSRKLMLPKFANKPWELAALVIIGLIGLWAVYHLVMSLVDLAA